MSNFIEIGPLISESIGNQYIRNQATIQSELYRFILNIFLKGTNKYCCPFFPFLVAGVRLVDKIDAIFK